MKNLKISIEVFLLFFISFIFFSCSGTPSVSAAKEHFNQKYIEQFRGKIKLVDFKKTNGMKSNDNFYTMQYAATVEFQQDCWAFENLAFYLIYDNKPSRGNWPMMMEPQFHKHGDRIIINSSYSFHKTENGWIVNN